MKLTDKEKRLLKLIYKHTYNDEECFIDIMDMLVEEIAGTKAKRLFEINHHRFLKEYTQ